MKHNRLIHLGYGIILSFVYGLSGCYFDEAVPGNRPVDYRQRTLVTEQEVIVETNGEKSTSKDPVQSSTPGPKNTPAPELPVIQ